MDISSLSHLTKAAQSRSIISLFSDDVGRVEKYSASNAGLYLDFSKQNITNQELSQLFELANSSKLIDKIKAQFSGETINNTEKRAVLHTILRSPNEIKRQILGAQADEVIATEQHMAKIVDDISSGTLLSASGEKFTDIITIGIGGSYYGIKVALSALKSFHTSGLNAHVVANVDGAAIEEKLAQLNAASTLVIIISKTFTTQETLLNALAVKNWMLNDSTDTRIIEKQWFAVSTNIIKATEFGLLEQHILPMWDWVGGRFSLWSAVGLPLALVIYPLHLKMLVLGKPSES
jgi:glucose-6-phosphate isomerase